MPQIETVATDSVEDLLMSWTERLGEADLAKTRTFLSQFKIPPMELVTLVEEASKQLQAMRDANYTDEALAFMYQFIDTNKKISQMSGRIRISLTNHDAVFWDLSKLELKPGHTVQFDGNIKIGELNTLIKDVVQLLEIANQLTNATSDKNLLSGLSNAMAAVKLQLAKSGTPQSLEDVFDFYASLSEGMLKPQDAIGAIMAERNVNAIDNYTIARITPDESLDELTSSIDQFMAKTARDHLIAKAAQNAVTTALAGAVVSQVTATNSSMILGLLNSTVTAVNEAAAIKAASPVDETDYVTPLMLIGGGITALSLLAYNRESIFNGISRQLSKFSLFGSREYAYQPLSHRKDDPEAKQSHTKKKDPLSVTIGMII